MNCPICNTWTEQIDTRKRAGSIFRRYECANLHRFTTKDREVFRVDEAKQRVGRPKKNDNV
jgi:transcriptional regulator NrdR family protein